jgi:hypothetical protein
VNYREGCGVRSLSAHGAAGSSARIDGKTIGKRVDSGATLMAKGDARQPLDFRNAIK